MVIEGWRHERWIIVDSRNPKWRFGMNCYLSEAQALQSIAQFTARDARGGRPDIHAKIPFMVPRRLEDDET